MWTAAPLPISVAASPTGRCNGRGGRKNDQRGNVPWQYPRERTNCVTSNPLFNNRKLKLGTFCSNLSGGATMSSVEGTSRPMAEHRGDRADGRRDGIRGAGSGRALEGFRRHDQFQRRRLRVLHLGRRDGRHHQKPGGVLDLACADHASGHGREAGHHHRSYQRRPLHLERGDRLVPARDRDVRRAADRARRALRHGVGMDRDHQAAVDQRGGVRLRRQIYQVKRRATRRCRCKSPIRRS